MSIYTDSNIHSYTKQLLSVIPCYFNDDYKQKMEQETFDNLMSEISNEYKNHKAPIDNIKMNFKNGFILDPHLPKINFAKVLKVLWEEIKTNQDNKILLSHFSETLKQIGKTCIQGITHRIMIDYIALYNDIVYQEVFGFLKNTRLTNKVIFYL